VVRQARAQQTRSSLIDAAAAQFARHGYTGATVARISRSAGVTSGALTFHFLTKEDLAHAVSEAGAEAARSALREVQQIATPGLAAATRLTQVLAAVLAGNVRAHAAVRLAYECPGGRDSWENAWRPALTHALGLAQRGGATEEDLADIELLVAYLLAGAEAQIRSGRTATAVEHDLGRLWQCVAVSLDARPDCGTTPCGQTRVPAPASREPREDTGRRNDY
jgi:AcrR family transcriptional regulator